jgi:hypothetical protein
MTQHLCLCFRPVRPGRWRAGSHVSVVKLFGPTDRREFRPRLGGLGV